MDDTTNNPVLEVRGLTKRFWRSHRREESQLQSARRRDLRPIGRQRLRQVDRDEIDLMGSNARPREVRFRARTSPGSPRTRSRKGFGMVFQHSRPLNRQTVLENIMVALLPDSLFMLFADKALRRARQWIANRVGLGSVMDRRPPTLPFADLRRLELRKPSRATPRWCWSMSPSPGSRCRKSALLELIRSFRDEGRAVLLVDHNVKSVAALVDRCSRCISARRSSPAAPTR